ncbi:MAG: DEAD/DEAH box helicase [Lysobacterales bacterium]
MSKPTFSDVRFDSFSLAPEISKGLADAGFEMCTPIQAGTLPLALEGKDVAGQGQTGTGKTGAFLVAAFQRLLSQEPPDAVRRDNNPRAIILAPTRELAIQIHKDAEVIGAHTGLKLALAYGGIDYEKQRTNLANGVDVLIGTPGRIIDYFKQKVFNLQHIEVLVMDEADRMFDLGFIKDIRFLLRRMPDPDKRLNMLFSATLSFRVTELAYEHMNSPERVEIEVEQITADRVTQCVYFPANSEKIPLLIGLLRKIEPTRTMVFCNTKRATEKVNAFLKGNGFISEVLSGDVRQNKRQTLLGKFHDGEIGILVATDVAARGLHIPDVSHVFNFDLPHDSEDYVHRIGRTARLGAAGDAISFACEDYAFSLPEIETYIEASVPVKSVDPELLVKLDPPVARPRKPRDDRGGRGGRPGGGRSGGRSHGGGGGRHRSGSGRSGSQSSGSSSGSSQGNNSGNTSNGPSGNAEASGDANGNKTPTTDGSPAPRKRRRRRRKPKPAAEQG